MPRRIALHRAAVCRAAPQRATTRCAATPRNATSIYLHRAVRNQQQTGSNHEIRNRDTEKHLTVFAIQKL
jgi:hypothetical protein